jgi:hypothetical protein
MSGWPAAFERVEAGALSERPRSTEGGGRDVCVCGCCSWEGKGRRGRRDVSEADVETGAACAGECRRVRGRWWCQGVSLDRVVWSHGSRGVSPGGGCDGGDLRPGSRRRRNRRRRRPRLGEGGGFSTIVSAECRCTDPASTSMSLTRCFCASRVGLRRVSVYSRRLAKGLACCVYPSVWF